MKFLSPSIGLILVLSTCLTCNNKPDQSNHQTKTIPEMKAGVDTLKMILDAFNRHDLDAIMEFFSDECSFDFPKGPDPWGKRFVGKAAVREALAGRFKTIPDVHYGNDSHWISADGHMGVSEWLLTGTTVTGIPLKVQGCDLWEFSKGKVSRKNSYWKIVDPPTSKS
jgi:ketosteroid isomerase-like protein